MRLLLTKCSKFFGAKPDGVQRQTKLAFGTRANDEGEMSAKENDDPEGMYTKFLLVNIEGMLGCC